MHQNQRYSTSTQITFDFRNTLIQTCAQGPDCGFHCVPNPPKYNFLTLSGGAICECDNCYSGTYCDIFTCQNDTSAGRVLLCFSNALMSEQGPGRFPHIEKILAKCEAFRYLSIIRMDDIAYFQNECGFKLSITLNDISSLSNFLSASPLER